MSDLKQRAEIFQGYVLTHMNEAKALVRDLAAEVERLEAERDTLRVDLIDAKLTITGKLKWVKVQILGQDVQCLIDPAWEGNFQHRVVELTSERDVLKAENERKARTIFALNEEYREVRDSSDALRARLEAAEKALKFAKAFISSIDWTQSPDLTEVEAGNLSMEMDAYFRKDAHE